MARRQSFSLLMATFIGTMDSNALVPVIALYALYLDPNIGFEFVGLIVAMYSIVHIPSNIVFGRLADKIGRRNPLVLGLSWDAFSVFLYSVAGNPFHLLLVRCMHGMGGGFVGPSSMSIAAGMASEGRKGRMMALYGISLAFSVIVGFMLSGVLVSRFSYNALFYVLALSLVIAVPFAASIKEPKVSGRVKTTLLEDLRKLLDILRKKLARASYAAIFCLYFAMGSFTVLVPLSMESLGLTEVNVAMAFTTFAVLSLVVHYPSGWLSDKLGPKVPAIAGLLTIALSLLLLPFLDTFLSMLPVMALFGVGHGLVFPSSSTMVVRSSSEGELGLSTGVFYALLVAGVAVGAPIAGFLANAYTIEMGLWATALASTIGGILVLGMLRKA
ncbi:MAG: MFS transporter [Candidatus Thermoplasmatota archaeon]|nr:MFS transporter [Candidatus Thermoplasmatota archaeon]